MSHSPHHVRAPSARASALIFVLGMGAVGTALAQSWPFAGADLNNSHSQRLETQISPSTAPNLKLHWQFATAGDVTAIPAVVGGAVYFPDTGGFIYKVDASSGQLIWKQSVPAITGVPGDYARATPAIFGNTLIIGSQSGRFYNPQNGITNTQARVLALDTGSGKLLWQTVVDSTPQSYVTTSAAIAPGNSKSLAILGVASNEELTAAFYPPSLWQWQFRGSAVALNVATGAIVWQTYTVPQGYFGAAIWGSTPAIDLSTNTVFVGTGDTYMAPPSVLNCMRLGGGVGCLDPNDHADSIMALDLHYGNVRWARRGYPVDVWSVACGLAIPPFNFFLEAGIPGPYPTYGIAGNCPDPTGNANPNLVGPDYDFAQGPMLFGNGLVGAGEKSGVFSTFTEQGGHPAWATQVSPGGVTGGMQWGSATDGKTIFTSASNAGPSLNGGGAGASPWPQYQNGVATGEAPAVGGWAAVDAQTGAIKWTTPVPNPYNLPTYYGIRAEGPVTLANGVVFGCDMTGTYRALDARTGAVIWSAPLAVLTQGASQGNSCIAGAAIVNGMVYWGSGDGRNNASAAKALFAFGL
jgi:polyvinyl alcohol dehydrogenase (cytochrome)